MMFKNCCIFFMQSHLKKHSKSIKIAIFFPISINHLETSKIKAHFTAKPFLHKPKYLIKPQFHNNISISKFITKTLIKTINIILTHSMISINP